MAATAVARGVQKNEVANDNARRIECLTKFRPYVEFEPDGTVVNANQLFLELTGYTMEDIKGKQNATTNEMTCNVGEAAKGSGEITKNIAGVAEAAKSTTSGANDSLKAAQALAEMSTKLHELVAQFKLEDEGRSAQLAKPQAKKAMSSHTGA